MQSYTDKKIIKTIFDDIINNGKFPNFSSPEMKCDKCMFYGVACLPSHEYVGCFSGWKREVN